MSQRNVSNKISFDEAQKQFTAKSNFEKEKKIIYPKITESIELDRL